MTQWRGHQAREKLHLKDFDGQRVGRREFSLSIISLFTVHPSFMEAVTILKGLVGKKQCDIKKLAKKKLVVSRFDTSELREDVLAESARW